MTRILCVVIGYFAGTLLTAEIVTRRRAGKRAEIIGTGNPGAANIGAQLGKKWGAVVLAGDMAKTVLACLLCRYVITPDLGVLAIFYAGAGTALGHMFPFWNRFRGGRGVAVTCTYILLPNLPMGLLVNLIGLFSVLLTGYLSVGSMVIPVAYIFPAFWLFGKEAGVVAAASAAFILVRHMDSMRRIAANTEKKTTLLKKK